MRPRHKAAEYIPTRDKYYAGGVRASMRPRHKAAEYVHLYRRHAVEGARFNEAAA